MVEACREGGKDKFAFKRQTQKQDERGEIRSGREEMESALTSDHNLTLVSV